ncbi:MAG: LPS export ABC transporter periplasmic protein LptC [Nitrospinae bacterium]|nr:LPS export ABC transporter periplasmic protein LptC [Nitrospinota bacterium]
MINKVRKILLLVALGVVFSSVYYFYAHFRHSSLQIKLRKTDQGVNVVIENFKVVHEEKGRPDWELTAESAQVNQQKKETQMKNVSVKLDLNNDRKYWISAESGVLRNDTQDFDLEGNVRFVTQSEPFLKKFKNLKNQPSEKADSPSLAE